MKVEFSLRTSKYVVLGLVGKIIYFQRTFILGPRSSEVRKASGFGIFNALSGGAHISCQYKTRSLSSFFFFFSSQFPSAEQPATAAPVGRLACFLHFSLVSSPNHIKPLPIFSILLALPPSSTHTPPSPFDPQFQLQAALYLVGFLGSSTSR